MHQVAGYATAVSLGQALKQWVGCHSYSLSVLLHSMLRRPVSVDANLQRGQVAVFRLGVSSVTPHARSCDRV